MIYYYKQRIALINHLNQSINDNKWNSITKLIDNDNDKSNE